jgi:signal peptidase I
MKQGEKSVKINNLKMKKVASVIFELVKIIVIALAIVIPIRYFLIQPFYVKGASMEPTFYDHEYLIVNELTYRMNEPNRGDVIVFKYPRNPEQYFIKRVIALPGESIKIENGLVYIQKVDSEDWLLLDESGYLNESVKTYPNFEAEVLEEEYFLMGDNRSSSLDSRIFGAVKNNFIIGKTWLRAWPMDKITNFEHINYDID